MASHTAWHQDLFFCGLNEILMCSSICRDQSMLALIGYFMMHFYILTCMTMYLWCNIHDMLLIASLQTFVYIIVLMDLIRIDILVCET